MGECDTVRRMPVDVMRIYSDGATAVENAILEVCDPVPGGSLLDVGCGDGRITSVVAERVGATDVHGIEISPEAGRQAAERGVQVHPGDLCAPWPYADATFDVVHANQVIEHVPCTDHFLTEIRRVLKPSGYAVVCTNNLASWHNVAALVFGAQPEPSHVSDERLVGRLLPDGPTPPHSHQRIFTARALVALAEHHGLRSDIDRGVAYYPLMGRAARFAERVDRRHAAYILHRLRPAAPR